MLIQGWALKFSTPRSGTASLGLQVYNKLPTAGPKVYRYYFGLFGALVLRANLVFMA